MEDPNPGVVVEEVRVPSKAVEAVEHSSASPVVDIGGRDFPMVDDPNITVPVPGRSPVPTGTPIHVKIDPFFGYVPILLACYDLVFFFNTSYDFVGLSIF